MNVPRLQGFLVYWVFQMIQQWSRGHLVLLKKGSVTRSRSCTLQSSWRTLLKKQGFQWQHHQLMTTMVFICGSNHWATTTWFLQRPSILLWCAPLIWGEQWQPLQLTIRSCISGWWIYMKVHLVCCGEELPLPEHKCIKNHDGSSASMEAQACLNMVVKLHNKYKCYVSKICANNDASTHSMLKWSNDDYMWINNTTVYPTSVITQGPNKGKLQKLTMDSFHQKYQSYSLLPIQLIVRKC